MARPPPNPAMQFDALTVRPVGAEDDCLKAVSMALAPGDRLAVLGANGSGKTLLLKAMAGLLPRSWTGGISVPRVPLGMAFQQGGLLDRLSTLDNVALPLLENGLRRPEAMARASAALAAVGLAGHEGKFPVELSGGMRKRAALARAMVTEPTLLLLDEPTAGLDLVTAAEILELLSRTVPEWTALVLATSDPGVARTLAARWIALERGAIVAEGAIETLATSTVPAVRALLGGVHA